MKSLMAHITPLGPIEPPNVDRKADPTELTRANDIRRTHPELTASEYVNLDVPRTPDATAAIAAATDGYFLGDSDGQIIAGPFTTVADAEAARA